MSNFKIDRKIGTFEDPKSRWCLIIIKQLRDNKQLKEGFSGNDFTFTVQDKKINLLPQSKAIVIKTNFVINSEYINSLHKKIQCSDNSIKIIYNKTITEDTISNIAKHISGEI